MFKEGELHMQQYPVRTIDLEALRENVRLLRSTLPEKTKLMAVVKADAYGHGIAKVARAALEAGASALAVARTDEGAALRQAGVTAPVLVLGGGIGNLIDRVLNGEVVDYINLLFMRFAVFNFADICVCVGVALWVLVIFLDEVHADDAASKEQ